MRSIDRRIDPARLSSAARAAAMREIGGGLARRRDVALVDAGALRDPFVGGVDLPCQVGIGEDLLGR